MTLFHTLAGVTLMVIAAMHSFLGESAILRPLLADPRWDLGMPRWAAARLIRFAWHLTSVAWVALGATAFGVEGPVALTITALASGVLIVVMLPGHLAWPLFLAAALWGAVATGIAGEPVLAVLALAAGVVATVAAVAHLFFATRWGRSTASSAIPVTTTGRPVFTPSAGMTLAVAAGLAVFAGSLVLLVVAPSAPARVLVAGASVVLTLRAVGEGRYVGFSKRVRSTPFARRDDLVFTPVVVALGLGGVAALAI